MFPELIPLNVAQWKRPQLGEAEAARRVVPNEVDHDTPDNPAVLKLFPKAFGEF
jgi:hypothetical protein